MHPKYEYQPVLNLYGREGVHLLYLKVLSAVALVQNQEGTAQALTEFAHRPMTEDQKEHMDRLAYEAKHETAGFVQYVRERLPNYASGIYVGLTSSDLMDTFDALVWQALWPIYSDNLAKLVHRLVTAEAGYREGRTHGRGTGEVVEVGHLYGRAARDLASTCAQLHDTPLRANLSGPVGKFSEFLTYSQAKDAAECLRLDLDGFSTQTADRHRYAEVAFGVCQLIGVFEQLATLHRLASVSGVDEYRESFTAEQKGSSSMPHKRNPVSAEQVAGLARLARGNLGVVLETAHTQWWERDLTNSSVERTAFRDLLHLLGYLLDQLLEWDFENWTTHNHDDFLGESPFTEYNRRILAGEDIESVYREVQSR